MSPTRRDVLTVGAGAAVGSLAGCLGAIGLGEDEAGDGYTAFFPIADWAEQVGGDQLTFENPVGTGRMGHGWSPDADITPQVAATEIFLYLDTPEFSWAQAVAENLERDHEDVMTVDLLSGLGPYLIGFDGESDNSGRIPEPDDSRDYPPETLADFDIWDLRSQTQTGYWHKGADHWHGRLPEVLVEGTLPLGIALKDTDGNIVPLGEDETYQVSVSIVGDADAVKVETDGRVVEFRGRAVGEAQVVFEITRGEEVVYDTDGDLRSISVVEEMSDDGFHDPHAWVDPVVAQEMVGTIADALAEMDPDNAAVYEENAASYTDRLAEVDAQFEQALSDAALDVGVFAGHNSYQYVERRYGFELKTPTGVSPDAQASRDEIIELIETVEDNDINTVLYDPFESSTGEYPQLVESILEESSAANAAPLSPVSGTTEEWEQEGWGWVGQMENVNLSSLETALNRE